MKPEAYTESLKTSLGEKLQAVLLYGSSAAGDYIEGRSDYNVLLLASDWSVGTLDAIHEATGKWQKAGNPAPLCFTPQRLKDAADVFPLEMLDILESHRVLHGEDLLSGIKVDPRNLRHQVEFELRSKLLKLRQAYLQMRKPEKALPELMGQSISSIQAVFRGALRLFSEEIPQDKSAACTALEKELGLKLDTLTTIRQIKENPSSARTQNCLELFARYLELIEAVLDQIDKEFDKVPGGVTAQ